MSWRDKYVQGSYRGVKFLTQRSTTIVGRQQPRWTVPFSEKGKLHIDLGRAPRRFEIKARFLGDDYDKARDALIKALETAGPGLLVHPYLGQVMVIPEQQIRIEESTEEGGSATVDFAADEAQEKAPPTSALDSRSNLAAKALKVRSLAATDFEAPETGFSITGVQDFVTAANLDTLDTILEDMQKINSAIGSVLSIPSNFADQIEAISIEAASLIQTPRKLFDAVDGALEKIIGSVNRVAGALGDDSTEDNSTIERVAASIGSLSDTIDATAALGSSNPATPTTYDTPDRDQESQNRFALLTHLRSSGLANAADAAGDAVYDSADSARNLRDQLVEAIHDLANGAIDGREVSASLFGALHDLAAAALDHLSNVAGQLGEVTDYSPPNTLPMLVIAHGLYGDATRAEDLVIRNPDVVHPGMVPGKVAIEVLSE